MPNGPFGPLNWCQIKYSKELLKKKIFTLRNLPLNLVRSTEFGLYLQFSKF